MPLKQRPESAVDKDKIMNKENMAQVDMTASKLDKLSGRAIGGICIAIIIHNNI